MQRNPSNRPSNSSLRSDATSISWLEPTPLDDSTARYALSVALIFLREDFGGASSGGACAVLKTQSLKAGAQAEGTSYTWDVADWEPALCAPARARKNRKGKDKDKDGEKRVGADPVHGAGSVGSFGYGYAGGSAVEAGPGGLKSRYTMYAHAYASDTALHGSYFASVAVLVRKYVFLRFVRRVFGADASRPFLLCRYAGRVAFNLSASNWPVVFSRVKSKLRGMAEDKNFGVPPPELKEKDKDKEKDKGKDKEREGKKWSKGSEVKSGTTTPAAGKEEGDDCVDLRLLSVCCVDRTRMLGVLQGEWFIISFLDFFLSFSFWGGCDLHL
jgi:hypothetical protein